MGHIIFLQAIHFYHGSNRKYVWHVLFLQSWSSWPSCLVITFICGTDNWMSFASLTNKHIQIPQFQKNELQTCWRYTSKPQSISWYIASVLNHEIMTLDKTPFRRLVLHISKLYYIVFPKYQTYMHISNIQYPKSFTPIINHSAAIFPTISEIWEKCWSMWWNIGFSENSNKFQPHKVPPKSSICL